MLKSYYSPIASLAESSFSRQTNDLSDSQQTHKTLNALQSERERGVGTAALLLFEEQNPW